MVDYILVFDKDGVIVDSEGLKIQSIEKIFAEVNPAQFETIKTYNRGNRGLYRKSKLHHILTNILNEDNVEAKVDQLLLTCREMVYEVMESAEMIPGVKDFIEKAPQKKYISSAAPQEEVIDNMKQFGIIDKFEKIYGYPNSDKARILKSISNKHNKPVFFFGDTILDMQAAEKANVNFIGIETEKGTFDGLKVNKVRDFREIDHIHQFIETGLKV